MDRRPIREQRRAAAVDRLTWSLLPIAMLLPVVAALILRSL